MATSSTKNKIMKLSQAEYTTLSTTGTLTKDGVTYTYSPSDTIYVTPDESKHIYSTTEQVVGYWVDGKPIYEKTFVVNGLQETETLEQRNDIDWLVDTKLSYVDSAGYSETGRFRLSTKDSISAWSDMNSGAIGYSCGQNTVADWTKLIVVFQYTKTTDTANS